MDLHEERLDQVTALSVKGRIDSTTAAQFGQKLEAVVADPSGRLVVDFRDLDYISSAGFRVLLVAANNAIGRPTACAACIEAPLFALTGAVRGSDRALRRKSTPPPRRKRRPSSEP